MNSFDKERVIRDDREDKEGERYRVIACVVYMNLCLRKDWLVLGRIGDGRMNG